MQCKKEDTSTVFEAVFYTSTSNSRLSLYIDGEYQGVLPYFSKAPECGQLYGDGQKPIAAQLASGQYEIAAKDDAGKTVSHGTISVSKNRTGSSGGIGGISISNYETCLVIGLYE